MFSQIHVWEHKVCYAQLLVKLLQTLLSLVQIKEAMIKRFQMRLFENIKLCLQAKQTQGSSLSPWHGEWILIRIKACVCVCVRVVIHTLTALCCPSSSTCTRRSMNHLLWLTAISKVICTQCYYSRESQAEVATIQVTGFPVSTIFILRILTNNKKYTVFILTPRTAFIIHRERSEVRLSSRNTTSGAA